MKKLKVMAFNVQDLFLFLKGPPPTHFYSLDEEQWQKLRSSHRKNKKLRDLIHLAAVFTEINPDVAMICEVGGKESLENFNHLFLHSQYMVFCPEGTSARGIDIGFLVKATTHFQPTLKSLGKQDHALSRLSPTLHLRIQNHFSLFLVGVHLKSKLNKEGKDYEGRGQRRKEIQLLATLIQEMSLATGEHFIILGDFNDDLRPGALNFELLDLFNQLQCQDALALAEMPLDERVTHFHFGPGPNVSFSQLDGILISPELQTFLVAKHCGVYRYPDSYGIPYQLNNLKDKRALPSDHLPVYAEFIF